MLPALRLLRHGDASLSHFNGMGVTAADHLATLLVYDGSGTEPLMYASHSGYARMETGRVVMVCDVGAPPPMDQSREAGGGCLSFELTSGAQRIVVNCGAPASGGELRRAARSTAAHSTATVADTSSCRFLDEPEDWWIGRLAARWLLARRGPVVLRGPGPVAVERRTENGDSVLAARHDGYVAEFGILHERRWRLSGSPVRLEGEDAFLREGKRARARPYPVAVRFHLHTAVAAQPQEDGSVTLGLPTGERWRFTAEGATLTIEESVYFAGVVGARRTAQIVLHLSVDADALVRWRIEQI
jgi:uncharacterized heparinase superfamily protein